MASRNGASRTTWQWLPLFSVLQHAESSFASRRPDIKAQLWPLEMTSVPHLHERSLILGAYSGDATLSGSKPFIISTDLAERLSYKHSFN